MKPAAQLVVPRVILTLPGLVQPRSRGWVRLRCTRRRRPPGDHANYGGETVDTDRIVTMVKIARDIYRTKATADWGLTELSPGPQVTDDAALSQWVLNKHRLLLPLCRTLSAPVRWAPTTPARRRS